MAHRGEEGEGVLVLDPQRPRHGFPCGGLQGSQARAGGGGRAQRHHSCLSGWSRRLTGRPWAAAALEAHLWTEFHGQPAARVRVVRPERPTQPLEVQANLWRGRRSGLWGQARTWMLPLWKGRTLCQGMSSSCSRQALRLHRRPRLPLGQGWRLPGQAATFGLDLRPLRGRALQLQEAVLPELLPSPGRAHWLTCCSGRRAWRGGGSAGHLFTACPARGRRGWAVQACRGSRSSQGEQSLRTRSASPDAGLHGPGEHLG